MFCFTAGVMAENLARHAADVWETSGVVFAGAQAEAGVTRFDESSFIAQPDISIDYAVMEKAEKIVMVPAVFGWSDIGSWDAVADSHETEKYGNSAVGSENFNFVATRNTHIEIISHIQKTVATVGVENLVIIDTPDALLVAERSSLNREASS